MIRIVDWETYPRKSHFEYFHSLAYPYMGITANVEVTKLLQYAKQRGGSGFLACLASTTTTDCPDFIIPSI